MHNLNPNQKLLLSAEYLLDINPLRKYEILFSNLNCSPLETFSSSEGRPAISKSALLKALIFKNLKPLPTLFDLSVELVDNPTLSLRCGLPTNLNPHAIQERLSNFLRDTPNQILQMIRCNLVTQLRKLRQIKGNILSIDSCAVFSQVKENNLNTSVKDRFNKLKIPAADPDARLGVTIEFPEPFQKKVSFFWGYRNHVICDTHSELPVVEITSPANVSEQTLFVPLFTQVKHDFHFNITKIVADAMYDTEHILKFVINKLHAKPYIAPNPRWSIYSDVKPSASGGLICVAGFEMTYWGKFKDRGRTRLKFVCPITHLKKFAKRHPYCPWNHYKFVNATGCYAYRRGDFDVRKNIKYGSQTFKKFYNQRTSSERIFSRFLTLSMQSPTVKGLNAVANHCTIAHISVLLLALTAVKTGHKDKIRFIKKFLPYL
ncbi:MAG: transposase [Patescibacteria group bacterium]